MLPLAFFRDVIYRAVCILSITTPIVLTQASYAGEEKVISQLNDAVHQSTNHLSTDALAKIAIVSGQVLSLRYNHGIDEARKIISFSNSCYNSAIDSNLMKNIMACYIADYEAAELFQLTLNDSRTMGVDPKWLTAASDKKLNNVLTSAGITDEQITSRLRSEFVASRDMAKKWLASHSLQFFIDCSEQGVGSSKCQ